jgi:hypothetical protein
MFAALAIDVGGTVSSTGGAARASIAEGVDRSFGERVERVAHRGADCGLRLIVALCLFLLLTVLAPLLERPE